MTGEHIDSRVQEQRRSDRYVLTAPVRMRVVTDFQDAPSKQGDAFAVPRFRPE